MRACQLCGACSWGPVRAPESFPTQTLAGTDVLIFSENARQCDNCGSYAHVGLIADDPPPKRDDTFPTDILAGIPTVLAGVMGPQAPPVTRTERLVASIMRGTDMGTAELTAERARLAVYLARCIERELDIPQKSEPEAPRWVNLSFADQAACRTWVLSVLFPALEKVDPLETIDFALQFPTRTEFVEKLTDAFVWVLETHVVLEDSHHAA